MGNDNLTYKEFMRLVRMRRRRKGLTQADIARCLGVSRSQYTALETGRSEATYTQLYQLAAALQTKWNVGPRREKH